jgi:hypothetical protein
MNDIKDELNSHRGPFGERVCNICITRHIGFETFTLFVFTLREDLSSHVPRPIAEVVVGRCRLIQAQMRVQVSEIAESEDLKTWTPVCVIRCGNCP